MVAVGPGNIVRGEDLFYCGKEPCNNGPSDTAGCFRCHGDDFDADAYGGPVGVDTYMHATSKKMLYLLANCGVLMDTQNIPCAEQSSWFNNFTEQDYRDLAAFMSSKDKNQYTLSGYAGPYTSIYVKSDYLPGAAVSFPNGHYSFTLPAGDYQIVPERSGYAFTPKSRDITLDFYQSISSGSDVPLPAPHSHILSGVNFIQSHVRYQPVRPDPLEKKPR